MKTKTTFFKRDDIGWNPLSVYCSPSTGDFLVGMHWPENDRGKVNRLNFSGQHIQIILENKTCSFPHYITENKNGDVVVSAYYKHYVEVAENGGKYRYSFRPSKFKLGTSYLIPKGICTDPLLNIMVCGDNNVLATDKDGQFLTYLLNRKHTAQCLNNDDNCHLLWVGKWMMTNYLYLSTVT